MLKKLNLTLIVILFGIYIISCSEDDGSPTDPGNGIAQPAKNFYPGGIGSVFKYNIDSLDNPNGTPVNIGTRNSSFVSSRLAGGEEIFKQQNQNTYSDTSITTEVEFWRTDNGVYFVVDTSGLSEIIGGLPDSLKNLLSFQIDGHLNAFSAPLTAGKSWSAFKFNASIPLLAYTRTLVDVTAKYGGQEEILSVSGSGNVTAERIDYIVKISIPDVSNLLDTTSQYFGGTGWFVENIGLMKLKGNALVINAIGSGSIDFADTSGILQETLTEYNLR